MSTQSLYHSELVQRSREYPVSLTIKSKLTNSKYPDKPPYVIVFDHEQGVERRYSSENEHTDVLGEWQGRRVAVMAHGREQSAEFTSIEEDTEAAPDPAPRRGAPPARGRTSAPPARGGGRPMPQRPPAAPPTERRAPQRPPAPPRLSKEERIAKEAKNYRVMSKLNAQSCVVVENALMHALPMLKRVEEANDVVFDPEAKQKFVSSIIIDTLRHVDLTGLPTKMPVPPPPRPPGETHVVPDPDQHPADEERHEAEPEPIEEDDLNY